jgi:hypothetical protein
MIDKIYTILGSIFLIIASPFLIVGLVVVFVSKCILRSTYIWYYIVIPYIKYVVITDDKNAWNRSVIERINARKYYE